MTIIGTCKGFRVQRTDGEGWTCDDSADTADFLNGLELLFDLTTRLNYFPNFELAFTQWASANAGLRVEKVLDGPAPAVDGVVY